MSMTTRRHLAAALLALALALASGQELHAEDDPLRECRDLSNADLGEIRGAYLTDNGLEFSFGLDKTVLVNGVPLLLNSINLAADGNLDLESSASMGSNALTQIQSGGGNSIDPSVLAGLQSGAFTFIQNSLDRAVIHSITKIDATINVRSLVRDLNLSSMLHQQLINSIR